MGVIPTRSPVDSLDEGNWLYKRAILTAEEIREMFYGDKNAHRVAILNCAVNVIPFLPPPPPPPKGQGGSDLEECPYCGRKRRIDDKGCPGCGAPLQRK